MLRKVLARSRVTVTVRHIGAGSRLGGKTCDWVSLHTTGFFPLSVFSYSRGRTQSCGAAGGSHAGKQPARHPWLIEKSCPVLVAASKLKPQKDLPMSLRAFALVRSKRSVRLLVLGEGPEQETLLRLAEEPGVESDVDFAGFVENPFAFFSRADLRPALWLA